MAGTVTFTHAQIGSVGKIVATCVGDASDGTFPATRIPSFAGRLVALRTNPGATAPTANYDIALTDQNGVDRLQGVGANRHTSNSEEASVVYTSTDIHPTCAYDDVLTLALSGNSVAGAIVVVELIYLAG